MVPQSVSGSMTSFRMSHEIVPVRPARMSHHIDPADNPWMKMPQLGKKECLETSFQQGHRA